MRLGWAVQSCDGCDVCRQIKTCTQLHGSGHNDAVCAVPAETDVPHQHGSPESGRRCDPLHVLLQPRNRVEQTCVHVQGCRTAAHPNNQPGLHSPHRTASLLSQTQRVAAASHAPAHSRLCTTTTLHTHAHPPGWCGWRSLPPHPPPYCPAQRMPGPTGPAWRRTCGQSAPPPQAAGSVAGQSRGGRRLQHKHAHCLRGATQSMQLNCSAMHSSARPCCWTYGPAAFSGTHHDAVV